MLAHGKLVMQGRGHEVFARSQELSDVGLNIPEISRLCLSLRERGIPVDDGIFTVEQAEQCLLRLLASRKQGTEGRA